MDLNFSIDEESGPALPDAALAAAWARSGFGAWFLGHMAKGDIVWGVCAVGIESTVEIGATCPAGTKMNCLAWEVAPYVSRVLKGAMFGFVGICRGTAPRPSVCIWGGTVG